MERVMVEEEFRVVVSYPHTMRGELLVFRQRYTLSEPAGS